tara:strand:+ start:378 stop:935 length:558 start_codon:yes stop_codon:yes gene_type:complete
MQESKEIQTLSLTQKIILLASTLFLIVFVFLWKGGFNSQAQLEQLARNSLEPNQAISNGKPTVIEFYADWCEVCNKMAPSMNEIEKKYENKMDLVLLNVDNNFWDDFIKQYDVNGIPHFVFLSNEGEFETSLIGFHEKEEMDRAFNSLLKGELLTSSNQFNNSANAVNQKISYLSRPYISPRSHG